RAHPLCSHAFSPTIPPPPRSTLFPYTTLFRSQDERYPHYQVALFVGVLFLALPAAALVDDGVAIALVMLVPFLIFVWAIVRDYRDRKSTRLNSSHLGISYAVFCLKKKKNYPTV